MRALNTGAKDLQGTSQLDVRFADPSPTDVEWTPNPNYTKFTVAAPQVLHAGDMPAR